MGLLRSSSEVFRGNSEMLRQKGIAQPLDRLLDGAVPLRFECQIAFGVETHGAVADVRRTDPDDFIIGDQELRVYRHAAAFLFVEDRAKNSQPAVFVRFTQSLDETRP